MSDNGNGNTITAEAARKVIADEYEARKRAFAEAIGALERAHNCEIVPVPSIRRDGTIGASIMIVAKPHAQ